MCPHAAALVCCAAASFISFSTHLCQHAPVCVTPCNETCQQTFSYSQMLLLDVPIVSLPAMHAGQKLCYASSINRLVLWCVLQNRHRDRNGLPRLSEQGEGVAEGRVMGCGCSGLHTHLLHVLLWSFMQRSEICTWALQSY